MGRLGGPAGTVVTGVDWVRMRGSWRDLAQAGAGRGVRRVVHPGALVGLQGPGPACPPGHKASDVGFVARYPRA